jgi:hypothetical protein
MKPSAGAARPADLIHERAVQDRVFAQAERLCQEVAPLAACLKPGRHEARPTAGVECECYNARTDQE